MAPPVCQWQAELLRPPDLPPAQLPHEDVVFIPHVSLQAILVVDSPDVDLRLWNATVAEICRWVARSLAPTRMPALWN